MGDEDYGIDPKMLKRIAGEIREVVSLGMQVAVVIGGVATGVPNVVDRRGCSVNDLIADELPWPSTARFVQHVDHVVRDLHAEGLLDGRQRAALTRAALHVARPVRR